MGTRFLLNLSGRIARAFRVLRVALLALAAAYTLYLIDYDAHDGTSYFARHPLGNPEAGTVAAALYTPPRTDYMTLYRILPDLFGGFAILLFGNYLLWRYKIRRKSALRNTVYQNAVPLLVLLREIETHYKDKALRQTLNPKQRMDHYVAFIRTFLWAKQRADRAIDLNDTISADTFLRLEEFEFDAVQDNTRAAYELTSSFEYITERLGSRDLFKPGYDDADLAGAEEIMDSLMADVLDSNLQRDLSDYQSTLVDMLTKLDGRSGALAALERDIIAFQKVMRHRGSRVPSIPRVTRRVAA